jgi:hypothetical protein
LKDFIVVEAARGLVEEDYHFRQNASGVQTIAAERLLFN